MPAHPKIEEAQPPSGRPQTRCINAVSGTVWQNYMLVMTQWPTANPPNPQNQGTPEHTFPGVTTNPSTRPTSAYANTTMETWEQTNISTGCMNCHNFASGTDFLWSPHLLAS